MIAVLRPVKDHFLTQVVFPVFEMGIYDARVGLKRLAAVLDDEHTRALVLGILERDNDEALFPLRPPESQEAMFRLLFWEWSQAPSGRWAISAEYPGWAAELHTALTAALMIESSDFPYADAGAAAGLRGRMLEHRGPLPGLVGFLCGAWDPVPMFAPDQVLATGGRAHFKANQVAIADWSWRSVEVVRAWNEKLPAKLSRLIEREQKRLGFDFGSADVLDYWSGRRSDAGTSVVFSGLGIEATTWVAEVARLAAVIREAAAAGHGMTSIVSNEASRTMSELDF